MENYIYVNFLYLYFYITSQVGMVLSIVSDVVSL